MNFLFKPHFILLLLLNMLVTPCISTTPAMAYMDDEPSNTPNPELTINLSNAATLKQVAGNLMEWSVDNVQADNVKKTIVLHIAYHDPSRSRYADITFKDVEAYQFPVSSDNETAAYLAPTDASKINNKEWEEMYDAILARQLSQNGSRDSIRNSNLPDKLDHGAAYFSRHGLTFYSHILEEKKGWILAGSADVHFLP